MKRMIRILIVDDERYARDELKHLLLKSPFVEIVGEAQTGEAAIIETLKHQPDVVFLDIDMPKLNGIEVARSLAEFKKPPLIVFATAYPQYAPEAFRIDAVDYLLKPYVEEELGQTVSRLVHHVHKSSPQEEVKSHGKLAIQSDDEIHYILPQDILYICREESMTKVKTSKETYYVRMTLKDLEERLSPYSIFRIHKSYLVNLDYISRLTPWFNGAYHLELDGLDEKLSVSRNYVRELRQRLEL